MPRIFLIKEGDTLNHFGKSISIFEFIEYKKHIEEYLKLLNHAIKTRKR